MNGGNGDESQINWCQCPVIGQIRSFPNSDEKMLVCPPSCFGPTRVSSPLPRLDNVPAIVQCGTLEVILEAMLEFSWLCICGE
jgi:hypothetical protein